MWTLPIWIPSLCLQSAPVWTMFISCKQTVRTVWKIENVHEEGNNFNLSICWSKIQRSSKKSKWLVLATCNRAFHWIGINLVSGAKCTCSRWLQSAHTTATRSTKIEKIANRMRTHSESRKGKSTAAAEVDPNHVHESAGEFLAWTATQVNGF